MPSSKIICANCLSILKDMPDSYVDIIFTDPPYGLGSSLTIRKDGKPDYSKAVDFMDKWDQPDGHFWESWFAQAFRVLKHGGRVVMFGMDRQLLLYKYYACLAGFEEQQSIYWLFCTNFPKASALDKNLMKHFGDKGTVVGKEKVDVGMQSGSMHHGRSIEIVERDVLEPTNPLAKKYVGYKYSIAPLKQTNETIMVFQKPYKSGSCMHDTLAMEAGDAECTCGAMNVESSRVEIDLDADASQIRTMKRPKKEKEDGWGMNQKEGDTPQVVKPEGRYPSQTFIECTCEKVISEPEEVKEPEEVSGGIWKPSTGKPAGRVYKGGKQVHTDPNCPCAGLDTQSGVSKSAGGINEGKLGKRVLGKFANETIGENAGGLGDAGGCSKTLHKCKFEAHDFDLYIYCPKVSKKERDAGLEGTNNHPTVKPQSLIEKLLVLFKTPNPQIIMDPFMGSGSTGLVCKKLGVSFVGIEQNAEYFQIARVRLENNFKDAEWEMEVYE